LSAAIERGLKGPRRHRVGHSSTSRFQPVRFATKGRRTRIRAFKREARADDILR
jgi:hypothetical protein